MQAFGKVLTFTHIFGLETFENAKVKYCEMFFRYALMISLLKKQ